MRSQCPSEKSQMAPSGSPSGLHAGGQPVPPPTPHPPTPPPSGSRPAPVVGASNSALVTDFIATQFREAALPVLINEAFKVCKVYFLSSWSSCSMGWRVIRSELCGARELPAAFMASGTSWQVSGAQDTLSLSRPLHAARHTLWDGTGAVPTFAEGFRGVRPLRISHSHSRNVVLSPPFPRRGKRSKLHQSDSKRAEPGSGPEAPSSSPFPGAGAEGPRGQATQGSPAPGSFGRHI